MSLLPQRHDVLPAGLGLYLCRELADAMDGSIDYLRRRDQSVRVMGWCGRPAIRA